jgi:hypothetical protein
MSEVDIAAGRKAWGRPRRGTSYDDWMLVAKALDYGWRECLAKTNKPFGKRYTRAMCCACDRFVQVHTSHIAHMCGLCRLCRLELRVDSSSAALKPGTSVHF